MPVKFNPTSNITTIGLNDQHIDDIDCLLNKLYKKKISHSQKNH